MDTAIKSLRDVKPSHHDRVSPPLLKYGRKAVKRPLSKLLQTIMLMRLFHMNGKKGILSNFSRKERNQCTINGGKLIFRKSEVRFFVK